MVRINKLFVLIAVMLLLAFTSAGSKAASPAPLNMSVLIINEGMLLYAPYMVDYVVQRGHRRVNFVISVQCQFDGNRQVQNYGLIVYDPSGSRYVPFDESLRAQFQRELRDAFVRAADANLEIAVLMHVDAADPSFGWRNYYDIDPLQFYGGYSYQRAALDTVMAALEESAHPWTRVSLELVGEMGQSVFGHPGSYRQIMTELRQRTRLQHLKLGINLNWGAVSGKLQPPSSEQSAATEQLIKESDFLGISLYGTLSVPPNANDFTATLNDFAAELKQNGVNLPFGFPIHFSEVSLGGGNLFGGVARDPTEANHSAWSGTLDPTDSPWFNGNMREFRREYHRALLTFLRTQPAAWPITAAYLWDYGSWDPYGISNQVFGDPDIVEMIRQYNAEIGDNLPEN